MQLESIGPYQVISELGRGAMGVVLRGYDPRIGRPVAIKIIRSSLSSLEEDEILRARFAREATAAGKLSHPGIVTIYQLGEHEGMAYLVMELVDGRSLSDALKAGRPLPVDSTVRAITQVAEALDYAHHQGVVHRDIKPANILMRRDGKVKLTDFGIARIASQTMTQTGQTMGTPAYMALEQVMAGKVDGRADQYSLAVVAYQMLAGKQPFEADTAAGLIYKIVSDEPVPLQEANPAIPAEAAAVVHRSLSKQPDQRYKTCTEFANALAETLNVRRSPGSRPPVSMAPKSVMLAPAAAPVPEAAAVPEQTAQPAAPTVSFWKRPRLYIVACLFVTLLSVGYWYVQSAGFLVRSIRRDGAELMRAVDPKTPDGWQALPAWIAMNVLIDRNTGSVQAAVDALQEAKKTNQLEGSMERVAIDGLKQAAIGFGRAGYPVQASEAAARAGHYSDFCGTNRWACKVGAAEAYAAADKKPEMRTILTQLGDIPRDSQTSTIPAAAKLWMAAGDKDGAHRFADQLAGSPVASKNADEILAQAARLYLYSGDKRRAEQMMLRVSNVPQALATVAGGYIESGDKARGQLVLDQALAQQDGQSGGFDRLDERVLRSAISLDAAHVQKMTDRAIKQDQEYGKKASGASTAMELCALAQSLVHRDGEAARKVAALGESMTKDAEPLLCLAHVQVQLGHAAQAKPMVRRALSLTPPADATVSIPTDAAETLAGIGDLHGAYDLGKEGAAISRIRIYAAILHEYVIEGDSKLAEALKRKD